MNPKTQEKGFFKNFFGQQVTNIKNEFFEDLDDESVIQTSTQQEVIPQLSEVC